MWSNRQPFGKADPYFDKDIGFYVFSLPWLHYLVDFAMTAVFTALLLAAVVHYLYGGIRLQSASRQGLGRGAGPAVRAVRGVPAVQGGRLLARPLRPDLADRGPGHRA